jgi:hypothetical protein
MRRRHAQDKSGERCAGIAQAARELHQLADVRDRFEIRLRGPQRNQREINDEQGRAQLAAVTTAGVDDDILIAPRQVAHAGFEIVSLLGARDRRQHGIAGPTLRPLRRRALTIGIDQQGIAPCVFERDDEIGCEGRFPAAAFLPADEQDHDEAPFRKTLFEGLTASPADAALPVLPVRVLAPTLQRCEEPF